MLKINLPATYNNVSKFIDYSNIIYFIYDIKFGFKISNTNNVCRVSHRIRIEGYQVQLSMLRKRC
jgi:hypothetical protein